jgi:hypothetical protein
MQLGDAKACGDTVCPVNIFAIGGRTDGTAPFQLPIHRLRLFASALEPTELDASGLMAGDLARYQPENSRSIMLSRGIDALEVQWDTLGWNAEAHDHAHATLDSLGGISLRCDNVSMLWDRAVASAGGVTLSDVSNWTSAALASGTAGIGLQIRYIDSDPCFDLVRALIISHPLAATPCCTLTFLACVCCVRSGMGSHAASRTGLLELMTVLRSWTVMRSAGP